MDRVGWTSKFDTFSKSPYSACMSRVAAAMASWIAEDASLGAT